jgi:preprotein translocase subunit SecG
MIITITLTAILVICIIGIAYIIGYAYKAADDENEE